MVKLSKTKNLPAQSSPKKRILLIITGSVAAYKAMDLIRLLRKKDFEITCILTKAACEFITPLLATSISGNAAHYELFSSINEAKMGHIALSRQHDLILIAPATADFIAKIANGYADDLASSVVLASDKKIFIAPAMNEKMWLQDSTQHNLAKLMQNGVFIIEPETDILACGEYGVGKLAAIERISKKIEEFFDSQNLLKGKKILITGGSTIEPIDPVRFIGNHSSGIQAASLVKILYEFGADIKLIAGKINEEILRKISLPKESIIHVKTADEMFLAVKKNLAWCNVFVACAAVADFKVKNFSKEKIKKSDLKNKSKNTEKDSKTLTLELISNPDILDFVGNSEKRPQMVIGFAAESENLLANAKIKMRKKNCDLLIANNIAQNEIFGKIDTHALILEKSPQKTRDLGKISKENLAKIIAQKIAEFLGKK